MNKKGFAPILVIIFIALVGLVGYFVYTNSQKNTSLQITPTNTAKTSRGTIEITDLVPPDFEKQTLTNFKLEKSKVNTDAVTKPQKRSSLIQETYAAELEEKAVYKVKRNSLTADQAIALAKEWGFEDKQITKKDIRNDYEYFLDWGELPRGNGPEDPIYQKYKSGEYDLLWISLVWDKVGKYGVGSYHRSSLSWHKSTANIPATDISKEEANRIALDFLKSKNLLPEGSLKTVVIDKEDSSAYGLPLPGGVTTRVFVSRTIDDLPVIDGGVSSKPGRGRLDVSLRGNQVIALYYEEMMTQIDYQAYDFFAIKDQQEALEELLNSKNLAGTVTFTNTFLANGKEAQDSFDIDINWSGNEVKDLKIEGASLAYYRNENHTEEPAGNYYQPVYVFKGSGIVSGHSFPEGEREVDLTFFIPAIKF